MAKGKIHEATGALVGQGASVSLGKVTVQTFQPLPDDHPAYGLIGLITSECARIEHFLDATIFEFAGLQSQARMGACITGQMIGMYPRYQALHQLALEAGAPAAIQKEIGRLEQTSNSVATRRNRAVHDAWMEEATTKEIAQFRTKTKKEPAYGPDIISLDTLKDDLAFIRQHLERVMKLRSDVWELYRQKPLP
jgi:hypothetical protein